MNTPGVSNPTPQVAILLCTWQGGAFLRRQLDSIACQTHDQWQLWASDDGSTDDTLNILRRTAAEWGDDRLHIVHGPREGVARHFMSLVHRDEIDADYLAFCDQDDEWEADKLTRALAALAPAAQHTPALYGSRTRYIDDAGADLGLSPLHARPPAFGNALVQCYAGGNTMLFNRPARALLRALPPDTPLVMHDWWAYLVVTGCGGTAVYDPQPSVRYRQHGDNVMGRNRGWAAHRVRISRLFQGDYRHWNSQNLHALQQLPHLLPEHRARVEAFSRWRHAGLAGRVWGYARSGCYRQTLLGNLGMWAAVLAGRI